MWSIRPSNNFLRTWDSSSNLWSKVLGRREPQTCPSFDLEWKFGWNLGFRLRLDSFGLNIPVAILGHTSLTQSSNKLFMETNWCLDFSVLSQCILCRARVTLLRLGPAIHYSGWQLELSLGGNCINPKSQGQMHKKTRRDPDLILIESDQF